MAKRRFLIKRGKGTIGIGARQIVKNEIIPIYENHSESLLNIQSNYYNLEQKTSAIRQFTTYSTFIYTDQLPDDFSGANLYFNPNTYLVSKNTKGEYFFGIDRSKRNSRLDPKGIFGQIMDNDEFQNSKGNFYCDKNENPTFEQGSIIFYKITANLSLSNFKSYFFSVTREGIIVSDIGTIALTIDDLKDAQSDDSNILLGTKEVPDSTGETRGARNVVVGKETILDGVGNDNVIIGQAALSGLGTNGNNNSNNNVVIGAKAATSRVLGENNVYVGGNTVSGNGSGSNNIVLGANLDIGGHSVNNVLNIGNTIIGNLISKLVTFVKIKLTGLANGSFNDSVLMINSSNEVEKLALQNFVNIKVYSYNINPQLNLSALITQETSYDGGNGIIGAFNNAGASRLTVAGKYITFFHATTGSQNPTSVRYEYRMKINNGFFSTSASGANPVDSVLIIAREDLTIDGIIDESTFIETQLFPSGEVFSFTKIENIFGVETKTTTGFFLRDIANTGILNAVDANISVMVKIIKTYADATNTNGDNNNVSLRRDNITTFIERVR
ncbi:hypothetical protein [Aquimarina longa]|uniref:hypothetical protein n=1 Tax=Aquimarina longa TaxID=1080221 RepID=UPI00078460D5|nr:hypothetical protein [Aquimarina longa]